MRWSVMVCMFALVGVAEAAPWDRHVITAGSVSGPLRGADGVALDTQGCLTTAWEEGGAVTRACPMGTEWLTEIVTTSVPGAEDARSADLDGDGVLDAAVASDSGARVYVVFRGTPNVTVTLPSSQGHGRVMQVAIADVDGDSRPDIVFGSRAGTPAVIAWLENPGLASARDPAAWTYHAIGTAGWAMSVLAMDFDSDGDIDIIVSDRASYKDAGGVTRWDLYGARWEEQTPSGWVNHAISPPAGSCAECTPGDEMFLRVVDWNGDGQLDVIDGTSSATKPNRIAIRTRTATGWSQEPVPSVPGVGHYQGIDVGDIDRDGRPDLVVSTWEVNALPSSSLIGVYWLGNGSWELHDISGPEGSKFDNALVRDVDGDGWLDVIDSEQVDQLGVVWYRNPGTP